MIKKYQSKSQRFLSSKITALGLVIILVLIIWAILNSFNQQKDIDLQSAKLENEIQNLEQQNLELVDLIDFFATQEYVEQEAREKLNLAKPGEKVVIIPEDKQTLENLLLADETKNLKQASPNRWWHYFFGEAHQ